MSGGDGGHGAARGEPVAIVGIGALFPGAGTAGAFWHNVRDGVDAIRDVPAHRWDPEVYYDPGAYDGPPESDRFYCRRGGFVDDLATFDPARFGITPASVSGTEPDQLLALRTAAEAVADAGGEDRLPDRDRIGVVIGRGGYLTPGLARFDQRVSVSHQLTGVLAELLPDLGERRLAEIGAAFRARLAHAEDSGGLVPGFAASRIAGRFDLRGPAYTVDAGCASSLVAVEHAVRALRTGQCDAMLAGAVHHAHHATVWSLFTRLRALSRTGRIRPFDRAADGTLLAEGTGIVLLKRLADAERDGDRVHAVIRGVGSSSDGRAGGIMSPLVDGQVLALERAWRDAGLDPADPGAAGLVEAHGTATPAGDAAELATLLRVFGAAAPGAGPPLWLGTVKSMIGHALPAAGIAGLIKAAFALREAVLPPTLHVEEPHPALAGTRLRPVREAAEWEPPGNGTPRRAVVNAFGFGGANAHVILEEHAAPVPARARHGIFKGPAPRPAVPGRRVPGPPLGGGGVLRLEAASPEALTELLDSPDAVTAARTGPGLSTGAISAPAHRLAIVEPTARKIDLARAVVARGTPWRGRGDIWYSPRPMLGRAGGRTAFLFPGFEPAFEPRIDDVARHFGMRAPRLTGRDDLAGHAADVIAAGRLLADALARAGIEPDVVAGHGPGEWTAMIVAGLYPPEAAGTLADALERGPARPPGAVHATLGCGADRAQEAIGTRSDVVVSHDNCPHQSVICGSPEAVREVLGRLAAEGVLGRELPFRAGLHTAMAEVYLEAARRSLEALPVREAAVPVWSATTAAPFPADPAGVRALAVRHLREPVRFSELIEELHAAGVRAFVQVGPGGLAGFAADRLGGREHLAMAVNVPQRDGMAQLRRVVAALWAEGYGAAPSPDAGDAGGHRGPTGVRLDLGSPLVRLDGAVPPLGLARAGSRGDWPELPTRDPVMAELDALLREAAATAQSVVEALEMGGGGGTDPLTGTEPVHGADGVPGTDIRPGHGAGARRGGPSGGPPEVTGLTTSRTFSLDAMPYLADHCVIHQPDGWPEMADRFPVVPLATLLEVMAEAARELLPELVVIGFEDVRALRWVVACPPTTADIRAQLLAGERGPRRVKVVVGGHADGVVVLAERYPEVPPRLLDDRRPLQGEGPPPVTAAQLYAERWMFHGPLFQGVTEITAMAPDGVRGVLTASATPGALLDGAGQLCGHWIQVYGETDQNVFPIGVGRISLYGPPPPAGERLDATVSKRSMSANMVKCDVELVRSAGGSLWGRVEGWTTRRFHTDEATWRMRFTPELSGVAEPQAGGWCLVRRHWDGSSARDLLMRTYLGAAEREEYRRLPHRERGPWLLGRIAVKDAVRHWLWERGHGPLFPAELTVRDGAVAGRPVVTGPFETAPEVAVAHSALLGVALVRPAGEAAGIAVEPAEPGGAHPVAEARLRANRAAATRAVAGAAPSRGPAAERPDGAGPDRAGPDGDRPDGEAPVVMAVETRLVDDHIVAWTVTPPRKDA
ncbi:type I polyketide synthase [Actinomadura viridis]|uniref:Acyl transferase domain-containing protein n=1 Tax=Actinomadura viridis TaxID=58110 RepID=A0A931DP56_9ACTN|nr:type I polyketide synthase [Actinomadura viridis]MBG6091196.1 acyl transferase domain-containing protein [Actinomadura viridis]